MTKEPKLICPRCGSTSVEETTMGHWGPPETSPNRATCQQCQHRGNVGDWHIIAKLKGGETEA